MAVTRIEEGGLGTDSFNLPVTLNGTDGSSTNAGDNIILDASASGVDAGERLLYEGIPPDFANISDDTSVLAGATLTVNDDGAISVASGGSVTIDSGATITNNGTASGFGSNVPTSADGQALGSASLEWSDLYLADGAVVGFGDDQDVTLTHVADTGLLLNSTMAIQFNDASQYINAPSNTILDINATDEIELNATLVDVNANLDVSGTITIGNAEIAEAELEMIDGITGGTVLASKAVVVDGNKDIGTFRNVTIDGTFSDGNYTFDTSGNVSGLGTVSSGAITSSGTLSLGEDATIIFEGATDGNYETTLTVTDPTADRTVTLPNATGILANQAYAQMIAIALG